jgi:type IV pilus assembly protein PilM
LAKSLVGIDIGSRFTKVIELEQAANKINRAEGFFFPTPLKTEKDGSKLLDAEIFIKEICKFIDIPRLRKARVAVSLPHTLITVLSVFLPLMSKKELSYAAINEARQKMIPVAGPQHIFECLFIGEVMVNKIPRAEVLVIRTERSYVQKIIGLFGQIEVSPVLIAPSCTVLPKILPKDAWKKDESVAIVDFGWDSLNITIYKEENMVFMRNIVYGVKDIVRDFSLQLGIEEKEIERVLKEEGVPQVSFDPKNKVAIAEEIMRQKYEASTNGPADEKSQVNLLELRLLWQPHIDRIIQELRRSFVFYKEQPEAMRIEQIYFAGGGSNIKWLVPVLAGFVGGKCSLFLPFKELEHQVPGTNPFKNEIVFSSVFAGAMSLACGIPLPNIAQPMQVNFLPLELKQKEIIAARRLVFLIISAGFIAILSILSIQLALSSYALRKRTKKSENKLSSIKGISDSLKELSRVENAVIQQGSQIEELIKKRPDLRTPLQDLAALIPAEVLLDSCVLTVDKIEINAVVFTDYEEANKIIEQFLANLETVNYFKNINITPLELEEISPQARTDSASAGLRLTQAKPRKFGLSADIVISKQ